MAGHRHHGQAGGTACPCRAGSVSDKDTGKLTGRLPQNIVSIALASNDNRVPGEAWAKDSGKLAVDVVGQNERGQVAIMTVMVDLGEASRSFQRAEGHSAPDTRSQNDTGPEAPKPSVTKRETMGSRGPQSPWATRRKTMDMSEPRLIPKGTASSSIPIVRAIGSRSLPTRPVWPRRMAASASPRPRPSLPPPPAAPG